MDWLVKCWPVGYLEYRPTERDLGSNVPRSLIYEEIAAMIQIIGYKRIGLHLRMVWKFWKRFDSGDNITI